MWKHEQICNWNPANRACITCRHFTPRSYEERADCTAGEDIGEKLRNQCSKWAEKYFQLTLDGARGIA